MLAQTSVRTCGTKTAAKQERNNSKKSNGGMGKKNDIHCKQLQQHLTFDTPLAVLAAKERKERKCGTTAGAVTTTSSYLPL